MYILNSNNNNKIIKKILILLDGNMTQINKYSQMPE